MSRSEQSDRDLDLEFAARGVGALAVEVEDMLSRFPRLNTMGLSANHPHEVCALWRSLGSVRAAMLDLDQSVREAAPIPPALDIVEAA